MNTREMVERGIECCLAGVMKECQECPFSSTNGGTWECQAALGDHTLALIRQLEAQAMKWISIRDALPGLHEKVLFTPMCNEGAIYIGELNAVGEHGAAYFAVRYGKRKTCYSATHWMPLPGMPKEDKHAENDRS